LHQTAGKGFDWKKHAGTTLRVVTLKFPLSEIQQKRLADFQQLTGIKVEWEALPEDLLRQKVKVEHLSGATDLDVFLSYYGQEGQQFLASGWYTDTAPLMKNPELTNPDFAWDDFIPAVRAGATIDGKVPIVPDRSQALPILYFRRDLFEQFKLPRPKTWQDVQNAAKVIYEGTNKQVFGIVLRGRVRRPRRCSVPSCMTSAAGGPTARLETSPSTRPRLELRSTGGAPCCVTMGRPGPSTIIGRRSQASSARAARPCCSMTSRSPPFFRPHEINGRREGGLRACSDGPSFGRMAERAADHAQFHWLSDFRVQQEEGRRLASRAVPERQDHIPALHASGGLGARQSAWSDPEVTKALDPEFLETGRISTQSVNPGPAPHSITNVAKARDFIGEAVVASILGNDVNAAVATAYTRCVDLLKEERAKR
jgi:multiple sugar transport system substrate-binding protein